MKKWILNNGYKIFQILNGRINTYLICTPNGNILVDAGMKHHRRLLLKNIKLLQLPDTSIRYLIITHSHFDHSGNAAFIKTNENCKIIMSVLESQFTRKGFTNLPNGTNLFTKFLIKLGIRIGPKWFSYDPFMPDIEVCDYYNLKEAGLDIELISTPGHTSGSLSIIVNKEIALVGDTMFGVFRNSIFPPFADNPDELLKSWELLLETNCRLFLPGHGKAINKESISANLLKIKQNFSDKPKY